MNLLIRGTTATALIVLSVGTWVTSGQADFSGLRWFSVATFIGTILFSLWDRFIWKWPIAQRMTGVSKNVSGTWKGQFHSKWRSQDGSSLDPRSAYLVVRQTATSVTVTLFTQESMSTSRIAKVSSLQSGITMLEYLFFNEPRLSAQPDSNSHYGAVALRIAGTPAVRLSGHYWTDRDSKGELFFESRVRELAEDYLDATKLFRTASAG